MRSSYSVVVGQPPKLLPCQRLLALPTIAFVKLSIAPALVLDSPGNVDRTMLSCTWAGGITYSSISKPCCFHRSPSTCSSCTFCVPSSVHSPTLNLPYCELA